MELLQKVLYIACDKLVRLLKFYFLSAWFVSQHGPEAMMAIAFTRRLSVRPSLSAVAALSLSASTIVEVFETIIATGLKSYEHI